MTINASTTAAGGGTPAIAVTDHPIRFRDRDEVRTWLAGSESLPLIASWMGGERWCIAAWRLKDAAHDGLPIPLEDLDAVRALVGLEHADEIGNRQALWLQMTDLDHPLIWRACTLYETLEAACAVLRQDEQHSARTQPAACDGAGAGAILGRAARPSPGHRDPRAS